MTARDSTARDVESFINTFRYPALKSTRSLGDKMIARISSLLTSERLPNLATSRGKRDSSFRRVHRHRHRGSILLRVWHRSRPPATSRYSSINIRRARGTLASLTRLRALSPTREIVFSPSRFRIIEY